MNDLQRGKNGRLILVGTPIGNLKDITVRALETLIEADLLLCEDTRRTRLLLSQCKAERAGPVESFHDHSPGRVLEKAKAMFLAGATIAYATDGGMPGVSDPGYALVEVANTVGAEVTVVPGPSAVTTFFAGSALPSPKFLFHGFFPRTKGEVERVLNLVSELPVVHIFFEAPNRVTQALEILSRNLPNNPVVVAREMTKLHEEWIRGEAQAVHLNLSERERVRGECAFGIMGGKSNEFKQAKEAKAKFSEPGEALMPWCPDAQTETVEEENLTAAQHAELVAALKAGASSKDVAKALSKRFGISRRALYDYIVKRLT